MIKNGITKLIVLYSAPQNKSNPWALTMPKLAANKPQAANIGHDSTQSTWIDRDLYQTLKLDAITKMNNREKAIVNLSTNA